MTASWLKATGEYDKLPFVMKNEDSGLYSTTMTGHWKNINFPAVHYAGW